MGGVMARLQSFFFGFVVPLALGGCGLYVPEKDFLGGDNYVVGEASPAGQYEQVLIAHIRCELSVGLWSLRKLPQYKWIDKWQVLVTLKITADEQGGANPSAIFNPPFFNATSFFLGVGASGTAHATRVETISFAYVNQDLVDEAAKNDKAGVLSCAPYQKGFMIDGDLKIKDFLYDKIVATAAGSATSGTNLLKSPYTALSEEITFVATLSGNITPVWKLSRVTVNPAGNFLSASRSKTNDLTLTFGPVTPQTLFLHNASVSGSATATAIKANQ
jgi:hypothetical protein